MTKTVVLKRPKYRIEREKAGRDAAQFCIVIPADQKGREVRVWTGPKGYIWTGPEGGAGEVTTVDLVHLEHGLANVAFLRAGKKVR